MKKRSIQLVGALSLCVAVVPVQADTLKLKNGAVLKGTYGGGDAQTVIFISQDGTRNIPTKDLASLTFTTPAIPPPVPPPVVAPAAAQAAPVPSAVSVPAGTTLFTRTIDQITSHDPAGKLFGLVLDSDLRVGANLVAKAGTRLYGQVEEAKQAGRVAGKSELHISLASIEIGGQRVPLVTDVLVGTGEGSLKKTARRTIVGAAVGGAVNGSQGAKRGAGAGAASTLLKPGQTIGVAPNTLLQFSLEQPLTLPAGA
jgi:hypothetical protein